ncbi:hypothetical protein M426DRAFT_318992 [Hypoxylon sp. CI-4A]|nr:hypothetical protein M426DRAFT_318992 [Hypoxylon sp. CI-4A]
MIRAYVNRLCAFRVAWVKGYTVFLYAVPCLLALVPDITAACWYQAKLDEDPALLFQVPPVLRRYRLHAIIN